MTPFEAILLAPAAADPGNYNADDLARRAGWEPAVARRAVRSARRRGLVLPSRHYLLPDGERAAEVGEQDYGRIDGDGMWEANKRGQVLALLHALGPLTTAALARELGERTPSGGTKEAVGHLVAWGYVTPSSGVVVSPAGVEALRTYPDAARLLDEELAFIERALAARWSAARRREVALAQEILALEAELEAKRAQLAALQARREEKIRIPDTQDARPAETLAAIIPLPLAHRSV